MAEYMTIEPIYYVVRFREFPAAMLKSISRIGPPRDNAYKQRMPAVLTRDLINRHSGDLMRKLMNTVPLNSTS